MQSNKIILLLIILYSCSATKKQNKLFKEITGTSPSYIKPDSSVYKLNTGDLYLPKTDFYYCATGILGTQNVFSISPQYSTPIFLKTPTFLTQIWNVPNIFYAYPGCKLKAIQNKDGFIELKDLNGNEERNNELNFFQKLTYHTGIFNLDFEGTYFLKTETIKSISEFNKIEAKIFELKLKRLHFLDSMNNKLPMSKTFTELTQNIINNVSVEDSLLLYFDFKHLLQENNLYQSKISSILKTVNSSNELPGYYFDKLCITTFNLLLNRTPDKISLQSETAFYNNIDTVRKYFKNEAKDYLLASEYLKASKKFLLSKQTFDTIFNEITDKNFKQTLLFTKSIMAENGYAINNNDNKKNNLVSLKNHYTNIEKIVKKNKGKLILLDFWASWCSPCRENMFFSRKLSEEFKNKKISFIYISLDKNSLQWKNASLAEKISIKNSYRIRDLKNDFWINKFNILEIPRYILLDKNGFIITENAAYPDNLELKKMIEKELGLM